MTGVSITLTDEAIEAIAMRAAEIVLATLSAPSTGDASDTWPRWMSVETAARYLDVSPERIRKRIARHAIPFVQEGHGCRVFLDRDEIDPWMARQRIDLEASERCL